MGATSRIKAAYADLEAQYNDFSQTYGGLLAALQQPSVVTGEIGRNITRPEPGAPSSPQIDYGIVGDMIRTSGGESHPAYLARTGAATFGIPDPVGGKIFEAAEKFAGKTTFKSRAKAPWVARYNDLASKFAAEKAQYEQIKQSLFKPLDLTQARGNYPLQQGSLGTPLWAGPFNQAALAGTPQGVSGAYQAGAAPMPSGNVAALLSSIMGGQR